MKTIRLNILLLLTMLLPGIVVAGGDDNITKEKKISKTYIVNSNAGLEINNQYGQVYVTTWDEDKTAIEVLIRVSAKNEETVNRRLSSIDIEFDALKSLVKASTHIGNFSGRNVNLEINYTIKIPKNGGINIDNQYGTVKFGTINGPATIKCQYGDVYGDALNNNSNTIKIEYCGKSQIGYMKNGAVKAGYSAFDLAKGGNIVLNSEYTTVIIGRVNDITYRTEYGDVKINEGIKVTGNANYSSTRITNLSAQLNLTTNYGDINIARIDKNTGNVVINAAYTNVIVKFDEAYAFDFEYQLEYGNLSGISGLKFTEKKEKDFASSYKGYYRASGQNRMYIKAEYGNISLGKN
jgi:hypothetical protein